MVEKFKDQSAQANMSGLLMLTGAEAAVKTSRADVDERLTDIAKRQFESLVQRDPGNSSAWYNLACCYGRSGNAVLAAEYLQKALEATPDSQERSRLRERVSEDPDFSKVRGEAAFQAAIAA